EEYQSIIKFVQNNKETDSDWFRLESNADGTKWYEFDVEFDIPITYPVTAPEIALPELDGKTAKVGSFLEKCTEEGRFAYQITSSHCGRGMCPSLELRMHFLWDWALGWRWRYPIWLRKGQSRPILEGCCPRCGPSESVSTVSARHDGSVEY
ncbi:Ubiquitin-fold modifier-conjugating enzyme 1, partial [Ostertagia ostertagi]